MNGPQCVRRTDGESGHEKDDIQYRRVLLHPHPLFLYLPTQPTKTQWCNVGVVSVHSTTVWVKYLLLCLGPFDSLNGSYSYGLPFRFKYASKTQRCRRPSLDERSFSNNPRSDHPLCLFVLCCHVLDPCPRTFVERPPTLIKRSPQTYDDRLGSVPQIYPDNPGFGRTKYTPDFSPGTYTE